MTLLKFFRSRSKPPIAKVPPRTPAITRHHRSLAELTAKYSEFTIALAAEIKRASEVGDTTARDRATNALILLVRAEKDRKLLESLYPELDPTPRDILPLKGK